MDGKLEHVSATPVPKFEEPVATLPGIRTSVRHPETGVLCFSSEDWEREEKKSKETKE